MTKKKKTVIIVEINVYSAIVIMNKEECGFDLVVDNQKYSYKGMIGLGGEKIVKKEEERQSEELNPNEIMMFGWLAGASVFETAQVLVNSGAMREMTEEEAENYDKSISRLFTAENEEK